MTFTWDPERLARAVAAATGVHLIVEGPCPGGQVGAAYARWPDRHLAVLSWGPGVPLAKARRGPFAVDALRAEGYPAPATELAADTSDGLAVVQELLPGAPPPQVGEELLAQALELNGRHASALATRADVPAYPLYLREDGQPPAPQLAVSPAAGSSVPSSGKSSGSTSSGAQSGGVPVMARSRATWMASVRVGRSKAP
jgi:hypothetical protein